jgi:sulfate adenylyltransferase
VAELYLNQRQYLECEKVALGAFAPLTGFMNEEEFLGVVENMRLPTGDPFPLPVVLDLTSEQAREVTPGSKLALVFDGVQIGSLFPDDIYGCEKPSVAHKVFGTSGEEHPGVAHFFRMGDRFVGGRVELDRRVQLDFIDYEKTPAETRAHFRSMGWETIVGFQTRNVPHRAHEHLQRMALERCDGLFIQPLVGVKKRGDYLPKAILTAYRVLIDQFLPADRVFLGVLTTAMRYAGPREAVFHAIIRRNYGCTHFIVGRDHAGVGDYYGRYEAHELTRRFDDELGITILRFFGPFHCRQCDGIVTERTCPHVVSAREEITEISGTMIRKVLENGNHIGKELLRPEIAKSLHGLELFIDEETG